MATKEYKTAKQVRVFFPQPDGTNNPKDFNLKEYNNNGIVGFMIDNRSIKVFIPYTSFTYLKEKV